jgi:hypothetical protein
VLDEVAARQHQPAAVPDPHHHIGEGDLLDVAPLALHHHGVVEADRLREGDLQACDEVPHGGTGRHPHDDADDPGGGQQAGPDRARLREREQHRDERQAHDRHDHDPPKHLDLGARPACS